MSKTRKRMSPELAAKVVGSGNVKEGLDNSGRNWRYWLDKDQFQVYLSLKGVTEIKTETDTSGYSEKREERLTAWHPKKDRLMSKEEYCKHHKIDINSIHSAKLVSHTGTPYYNIAFKDKGEDYLEEVDWDRVKDSMRDEILEMNSRSLPIYTENDKEGVVKIADIHLGAYIDGLIKSPNFSISTITDNFDTIASEVNTKAYKKVHIHLMGDLIESFTGLNHKNSWKGLGKSMFGSQVIKLCVQLLNELFSKINNLGEIKIIAGNHDRVTSDNKEDTNGDAADLISWGLGLIGYPVEFNSTVITHVVDDIVHVNTHGHHGISKKDTKDIIWDYGIQGKFNFVFEGHLHSRIQKLSATQQKKFGVLKDDSVDCRRQICPSIFTGNSYSEELGYTSTGGFLIIESNGKGKPNVFDYSL